ncbi:MAG: hypothetical protein ABL878_14735 [Burkholderiales bacterium]|jgi:hypothetical protein
MGFLNLETVEGGRQMQQFKSKLPVLDFRAAAFLNSAAVECLDGANVQ